MAKNKALLIALGGSIVGILGYLLPWITVNIFFNLSISGFSMLGMLFGTGNYNFLQELGYYSTYFIVPAILLVLALIASLFTGTFSALMIRSNSVTKISGTVLTSVSGIVFLIVAGIALVVSIAIRQQVGSYVDVGSYLHYGAGFFITCLGALTVMISGIIIFRGGLSGAPSPTNYSAQSQIPSTSAFNQSGVGCRNSFPGNYLPPMPVPGLNQISRGYPQGQVGAPNQAQFQPTQLPPQQPYSGLQEQPWQAPQSQGWSAPTTPQKQQQFPNHQNPTQQRGAVPNRGWALPPKPTPSAPIHFHPTVQPPPSAPFVPPQPWSGSQQPGSNKFTQQPPQFRQNHSQAHAPQNQFNPQQPFDKPWERVRYNGPKQAPKTPQGPPVPPSINPGQGQVWNQPPKHPFLGQEDSHTRGDFISPIEDSEITRYDNDLGNEVSTNDTEYGF